MSHRPSNPKANAKAKAKTKAKVNRKGECKGEGKVVVRKKAEIFVRKKPVGIMCRRSDQGEASEKR